MNPNLRQTLTFLLWLLATIFLFTIIYLDLEDASRMHELYHAANS